jgi:hypothetical protein
MSVAPGRTQRWRRLGHLFTPEPQGSWGLTHSANPTALPLDDRVVRIFFSTRDAENRAHVASVDFEVTPAGARRISNVRGPLLAPGPRGSFDADGVTVSSLVRVGDRLFAYYLGWTRGVSVLFTNFIGLAIGDGEGLEFERAFRAPVVGRTEENPFTLAYPWVLREDGRWRMWFSSCVGWGAGPRDHRFVINAAESSDGLTWRPTVHGALSLAGASDPLETALARPTVLRHEDGFSMWYARQCPQYRLGYAWSADGDQWERRDDAFRLEGPLGAWEQHEQTYPCAFTHQNRQYLLYNGDGYGRTGFGLALLEDLI